MEFKIRGTGEIRELTYVDPRDGVDGIKDLLGDSGAIGSYIVWDTEEGVYVIGSDDYDWWANYISESISDILEMDRLIYLYGRELVNPIVADHLESVDDYGEHHNAYLRAFKEIVGLRR